MTETGNEQDKPRRLTETRKLLLLLGACVVTAAACFIALAIVPQPEGTARSPVRGVLTGIGVFAIAGILALIGGTLKKRSADSPYFEGRFIAGFFNLAAFVCLIPAVVCIGLSIYTWAQRFIESH